MAQDIVCHASVCSNSDKEDVGAGKGLRLLLLRYSIQMRFGESSPSIEVAYKGTSPQLPNLGRPGYVQLPGRCSTIADLLTEIMS